MILTVAARHRPELRSSPPPPKRLPVAVSDYCCFLPAAQQPFAIQLAPQEELVGIDGVPLSYPCYRCARLKGLLNHSALLFCRPTLSPRPSFNSCSIWSVRLSPRGHDLKCPRSASSLVTYNPSRGPLDDAYIASHILVITTTCSWQLSPLHFKDLTTGRSTNKNDWPKYEEKAPVIHEEDLLEKMLAASTTDEADLLHFFLETGFRNGETAHSEYSDIT